MAQIQLEIGGNMYSLACRDGEEAQLRAMAGIVDAKAHDAMLAVGKSSEARTLLFAALLLADELQEARSVVAEAADEIERGRGRLDAAEAALEKMSSRPPPPPPPPPPPDPASARAIESLADRVEALATRLEKAASTA